jgi:hypothetical protein
MSFINLTNATDYLPDQVIEEGQTTFNINHVGNARNYDFYTLVAEYDGAVLGWVDFSECGKELTIQKLDISTHKKNENIIEEMVKQLKIEFPDTYIILEQVEQLNLFNNNRRQEFKMNEIRSLIRSIIEEEVEKWAKDVKVKGGAMHKALDVPEDKEISDVYSSAEAAARKLIKKVGRQKAAGMINFAANVSKKDNFMDQMQRALSKIED